MRDYYYYFKNSFNVVCMSIQSVADAGSSNITRLPIPMSGVCNWLGEENREERKKER
jgi:hypothetical protein